MLPALVSLVAGLLLGLSLAAPPGPMNAVIAAESVDGGFRSGFAAGLGAMTADACFFALALAGVATVVRRFPTLRGVMIAAGGVLMCYFAYGAAKSASEGLGADAVDLEGTSAFVGFRKAFALAITNPFQIIWWLTAGVFLLRPGTVSALGVSFVVENGLATVVGFFGGILLWITAFPGALVLARDRVDAVEPVVAYGSAVVLAGFGVYFLYDAGRTLVPAVL